jgi:hypothetical protein
MMMLSQVVFVALYQLFVRKARGIKIVEEGM